MNRQSRMGLRSGQASLVPHQPLRRRGGAALGLLSLLLGMSAHADVGTITTLHSFSGSPDGANPQSSLAPVGDGSYFGTTSKGGSGPYGGGTVFQIFPDGSESVLYSFQGNLMSWPWRGDGAGPSTGLTLGPDGNFYSTTPAGGSQGDGILFKVSPARQEILLSSFTNGADGGVPSSPLVTGNDGRYYTVSASDPYGSIFGSYLYGTVFSVSPPGAPLPSVLHIFSGGTDGGFPQTLIMGNDGNFYGTTARGGNYNEGLVFKITSAGTLTTLYSFGSPGSPVNAGYLPEALIQGRDGNFYGTTLAGGAGGFGTVFELSAAGSITVLYSFKGSPDGSAPASLIQGSDGNFYGTTRNGGLSWAGTVFEVTPTGQESTLYSLHGTPGYFAFEQGSFYMPYEFAQPPLLEIGKGTFLGTGYAEGAYGKGSVFQLTVSAGNPAPEVRMSSPQSAQTQIYPGYQLQLFWSSIGTSACTASNAWSGSQPTTGTLALTAGAPGAYTYTITCNTASGTVTGSTTINVQTPPAPTVVFPLGLQYVVTQSGPEILTVLRGTTLTLPWQAYNATSCTASGDWSGSEPTAGSVTVDISALGSKNYTLSCSGLGGSSTVVLSLRVVARSPAITAFTVNPSTITLGSTAQMQWTTTATTGCAMEVNGTEKLVKVNGQTAVRPTNRGSYVYSLICNDGSLETSAYATLTVN